MTEEQEAAIRSVCRTPEADQWVRLAAETNTPDQTYRAAALGLRVVDWAVAARAGASFDAAMAALRGVYFDEHGARQAAEEITRMADRL